ncbi:MAG TPA: zinc-binding dehydrogenase [Ktedonobacterales bacterium]|nr:zinc-binding dehydrogenase [Ktedonobacterales bacterium]
MVSAEMPAAVIHTHGAPPEHRLWPVPRRGPGQALVRVTAAPISPLDLLCASGTSYFGPPALPYIPGTQGVGTVEAAGTLTPGQRVWFPCVAGMQPGDGSMARFSVIEEASALALPDNVADELVAALGLSAIAAWMALTWRGQLRPGEQVLVLGAGGAVGQVAVQAARLLGAGRVIAASRTEVGRARALAHGADAAVDLSGDNVDEFSRRIAAACDGPLHLVIDPVWGHPAEAAARCLGTAGRLVNIGDAAGSGAHFASATVRSRVQAILGYTNNALTQQQKAQALSEILQHAAAGHCTVAHEVVPLARAGEAWTRQAAGAGRKLILVP